jgi:hypothetical protein
MVLQQQIMHVRCKESGGQEGVQAHLQGYVLLLAKAIACNIDANFLKVRVVYVESWNWC